MSEYLFGLHIGHLPAKADRIARQYGACHVNHTEPGGFKRGWFSAPNCGSPFDGQRAQQVIAALKKAGVKIPWEADHEQA